MSTPPRVGVVADAARFLGVGLVVLPGSLALHLVLVLLGVPVGVARAVSFVAGTSAVYVLNRRWTFRAGGPRRVLGFLAVYGVSFVLVLVANALALAGLRQLVPFGVAVPLAWVVSQGLGTTWTFTALRTLVFRVR